ncbi:hypothetical protein BDN71DRAFT_1433261 [Pleurotus eryngii]|uniref:Uncharacterized protein n=1 Tax=Pleurotus eryngii TaxID=5323 RepID=A0A9P5ZSI7_PLEER|nr:hypothetical protein BDN71DRAFT_1433261 [Pleurotus eryngii]
MYKPLTAQSVPARPANYNPRGGSILSCVAAVLEEKLGSPNTEPSSSFLAETDTPPASIKCVTAVVGILPNMPSCVVVEGVYDATLNENKTRMRGSNYGFDMRV